jgi:OOP family OmpA-OmpF porin
MVLIAAVASACASGKGPSPILCSQIGLAAGAAGGAVAVANNTSDAAPAIAAGVGGAIVGAAAGYFLCKALAKKEEKPRPKPAPPVEPPPEPAPEPPPEPDPCDQVIRLRGVNFDFDKSEIRSDASVILDEAIAILGDLLPQCSSKSLSIEGHTDWTGPEIYNQGLSERRAASVKRYLDEGGLEEARLSTIGYGETRPIATNETREGRALNRRVELRLVD